MPVTGKGKGYKTTSIFTGPYNILDHAHDIHAFSSFSGRLPFFQNAKKEPSPKDKALQASTSGTSLLIGANKEKPNSYP